MTCRRILVFTALVAIAVIAGPAPRMGARQETPIARLLDAYAQSIERWTDPPAIPAIDLTAAPFELGRLAQASGSAGDINATERRRRIVAAFALELAAAGARLDAEAARKVVEWSCFLVRQHSPLDEFDLAWQLAALAVLEGGIDPDALRRHLDHVQQRIPDEPRLILARGIVEEQAIAPAEVRYARVAEVKPPPKPVPAAQLEAARIRTAERAIAAFTAASTEADVGAEARVRLGHVQLRLGNYEDALKSWADVDRLTSDRALLYLVRLFRGLALEGLNRRDDARSSYLQALEVSPGAHSATMRLAALAFLSGQNDQSDRLVASLLRDDDPRRDPWWSYYAADWRFWYPRIARVRALLRANDGGTTAR